MYPIFEELVSVLLAIMHCCSVKLPRSTQQYMTHIHGHYITQDLIFVFSHLQLYLTLFFYNQLVPFVQPGHPVGSWMLPCLQLQLLYYLSGNQIVYATTIND